jgi:hypothetical protein
MMLAPGAAGRGFGAGPQGFGYQPHKPISQAQRNAETLFEAKNVVEILEVNLPQLIRGRAGA